MVNVKPREAVNMLESDGPARRREMFAQHLRVNRTRLFGYIHALVRNLADADDSFQQTAFSLWRRFDAYDPSRRFLQWECGVARLEAANLLRTRSRDRPPSASPS
ncbi:MAG: hypothetical protein EXS09_20730 [Gemmataceae bacterium]|nr:hypothetical protein [Gemmataceae bacterium]